jgi:hypothetical protein
MSLTGERRGREGAGTKGLYEDGKLGGASKRGRFEQDNV